MVEELRSLLDAIGVARPVVLLAHSFSGMVARLFAYKYPAEVAGLVLVDGAHEDQMQRFPPPIAEMFGPIRAAQVQQLTQLSQTIAADGPAGASPLVMIPPLFPPDLAARYAAQSVADSTRPLTMAAELEALEQTQAQVRAARSAGLGAMPLVVLSHGIPQPIPGMPDEVNWAYEAAAATMQEEQAAQSSNGRRVVAENAGHMIHHDRPDLVIAAIRQVVEAVRGASA